MPAAFDAMLAPLYQRLGDECTYTPAGGGAPRAVRVLFSLQGGAILGGDHIADGPSLRIATSDAGPAGVLRGATFAIGGTLWHAREPGYALLDGKELSVQLKAAP